MHQLPTFLFLLGFLVTSLGFFSVIIEDSFILSRPMLAVAFGILVGPIGLGLVKFGPELSHLPIVKEMAAITIAISVMGVALQLPSRFFLKRLKSMTTILLIVMPLMWLASSFLIYATFDFSVLAALVIGAIVTPTDPVLSTNVVQGELASQCIPKRIRDAVYAESGANDGLAYPIVFLPLLFLERGLSLGTTETWFTQTFLVETLGAIGLGALLGTIVGWLFQNNESKGYIEKTSFLVASLALTVMAYGFSEWLGLTGILAVFASGVAFTQLITVNEKTEEERVQDSINDFFTIPIFAVFGAIIPWSDWMSLGWKGPLIVIGIMVFRRLPAIFALRGFIPYIKNRRESLFVGWFAPIGVAALYYAITVHEHNVIANVWPVASVIIFGSVILHGVTETYWTKWLGRKESQ